MDGPAPLYAGENSQPISSNNLCGHHLNHFSPSKRKAQSLPRHNLSLNLTNLGDILTSCELSLTKVSDDFLSHGVNINV